MNKNAIKKFATEARRELISRVGQRALKYGISDKEVGNPNDDSVGGHLLSSTEKKQRAALIEQIKEKGYEQVMEEVAYTWFNRFSALRFMEVNGYLPTRVRVFTDENNAFKPQILTEAIHMELDGLDMEKVYAYKEANDNDELYKYLLITQCNALNSVLPGMFQRLSDYTELLFPDNLLREGSVVQQMIELIDEEDWKDAVQIIGWLYQYYNSEKKDDVFAALKKNVKITKENIPAATQLFTPDWIVRYMVENSLGRLWIEGHPNDELKSQWKYYLEEAEQESDVQAQLASIREEYKALKPEDILCIDPCSGSGHILAYMFDVLVQIYEAYGVDTRTAVASIVENNIYGLDIDDRAAQLAYFSVMMKACQYDKRFLRRKVQPHVYAIVESNHVDRYALEYFCNGDAKLKKAMDTIIEELHDAKEYGSIITVSNQDWDALYVRFDEIQDESVLSIYTESALSLKELVRVAEVLSIKYSAIVTNPPYMNSFSMGDKLNSYVKNEYPNSKSDLFAVMLDKCQKNIASNGMIGMITMHSWMFLMSFCELRESILNTTCIKNMLHLGIKAFEEIGNDVVQTTAFILQGSPCAHYNGTYFRLLTHDREKKQHDFLQRNNMYIISQEEFERIPGAPIAYWLSDTFISTFANKKIGDYGTAKQGLITGDNNTYLRLWFEPQISSIGLGFRNRTEAQESRKTWFPYNKGGDYRKWYGNNNYVVLWENDGYEIQHFFDKKGKLRSRPQNMDYYFRKGITWSSITTGSFSCRCYNEGFLFDSGANGLFINNGDYYLYIAGLLNTKIAATVLKIINPTINNGLGSVEKIPVVISTENINQINQIVLDCIDLSKKDWDSFEMSWNFKTHPLIPKREEIEYHSVRISDMFTKWDRETNERFERLKKNEELLNKIFIDLYGLQNDMTPSIDDKEVSISRAERVRDIKSLISYAVGCMFGRYSIDHDGLIFAGGNWDDSKYTSFSADKDNVYSGSVFKTKFK